MKNFGRKGKVLNYKNTTGSTVLSGALVICGALVGVAVTDILNGEVGAVNLEGVYTLPKATGVAIAQGAKVYWVTADSNLTTTVSSNTYIGYADVAGLTADAILNVILGNGI